MRRSGARAGDQLFVSGRLGFSALGLHRLKSRRGIRSRSGRMDKALRTHLYPAPRCAVGRYLSGMNLASAIIDVSDGLSTDLGHLCDASGVGARIWAEHIPCPRGLTETESHSIDALTLALHGGEDYELLFSVPKSKASRIPSQVHGVPLHWIGEVRSSRGVSLVLPDGEEIPLLPRGYDHFKR